MNSLKLEYPITKKDLHKGFNIKKQIAEKEKKEFLDKYVKDQLDVITIEILKKTIDEKYSDLAKYLETLASNYDYIHLNKILNSKTQ
jgi:2,3-bisphosphoglycerate-independent phosphoglycerate mutase